MEKKPIDKKTLYIGSAVVVTAGMGAIKLIATGINHVAVFVLGHLV